MQAVKDLPEEVSLEDAMERLLLLAKIQRGLRQADQGETVPHAQVKERWPRRG